MIALKVRSVDISNKDTEDQIATLSIFENILNSIGSHYQIIYRREPLVMQELESNNRLPYALAEYRKDYAKFLQQIAKGKLNKIAYMIIRTQSKCNVSEGKGYLEGVMQTVKNALESINISVEQVVGEELEKLYEMPSYIKECEDYYIYGGEYKRTYVIMDYPREGYPHWLKYLYDFRYPIEINQHFRPYPKGQVVRQLELTVAKIESTLRLQEEAGNTPSFDLKVRLDDANKLLRRLATGNTSMVDVSFYVTLTANTIEELDSIGYELGSYLRQCGLDYRTAEKEVIEGIRSTLPIAKDRILHAHMFDTHSLSTLLPFTVQDYIEDGGVVCGTNLEESELISLNRWEMPNPNMLILGKSGFGKSLFAKSDTGRQIINGARAFIIDHDQEWEDFNSLLGGKYIEDCNGDIDWEHHLLVFSGDNKTLALQKIWDYIKGREELDRIVLVIDEFNNILEENPTLIKQIAKEIRKHGVAPTFITQNVNDYRSTEGKIIFDNCSIKVLLRQGENDLKASTDLFELSRNEVLYLKTCWIGHGYLYTDKYKIKFKGMPTELEEDIFSTNPAHKMRRNRK